LASAASTHVVETGSVAGCALSQGGTNQTVTQSAELASLSGGIWEVVEVGLAESAGLVGCEDVVEGLIAVRACCQRGAGYAASQRTRLA
jgi:hypothetical protein